MNRRPYALGRGDPIIPRGRQLSIMAILWHKGSGTVTQIRDELNSREEPEIAYTTVLTYLQALRRHHWVRVERAGATFCYYPDLEIDYVRWLMWTYLVDRLYDTSYAAMLEDLIADPCVPRSALLKARAALDTRLDAHPSAHYRSTGRTIRDGRSAER